MIARPVLKKAETVMKCLSINTMETTGNPVEHTETGGNGKDVANLSQSCGHTLAKNLRYKA